MTLGTLDRDLSGEIGPVVTVIFKKTTSVRLLLESHIGFLLAPDGAVRLPSQTSRQISTRAILQSQVLWSHLERRSCSSIRRDYPGDSTDLSIPSTEGIS